MHECRLQLCRGMLTDHWESRVPIPALVRTWPEICEVAQAIADLDDPDAFIDMLLQHTYQGLAKLRCVLGSQSVVYNY
jgi:hypothetical protein